MLATRAVKCLPMIVASLALALSATAQEYAFRQVSAGKWHNVAIGSDGTLWAWGWNYWGQLGDGTYVDKQSTLQIGSATNWQSVSAGWWDTMAIKTDGTLWAWGGNNAFHLGDGTTGGSPNPVQIGSANDWRSVSAGGSHTVAIKTDGTLWAWGDNSQGQLGDGTSVPRVTPVQIGSETSWRAVSAGDSHTMAIKTDGSLWAWGDNSSWQLGRGETPPFVLPDAPSPVRVGSANNWQSVSAGYWHTAAIRTDGTLWAWGRIYWDYPLGQIIDRSTPTQMGGANWQSVSADIWHTVATKTDGTIWAWGFNNYGQLGDGTTVSRSGPVRIGAASDWQSVSAGDRHTVAVKADGSLWAWGYNEYNQLGDGTRAEYGGYSSSPVRVGPAAILAQPNSQTVWWSGTAVFGVTAIGIPPLTFQWRKNGTDLANTERVSGATTPTLTITNAQTNDAGDYTVLVTNAIGSITSRVATLTVPVTPFITGQPQSQTNTIGSDVGFCAAVIGQPPFWFQWRKNGTNLTDVGRMSGATTACLTITNLQVSDAGNYTVRVTNAYGAAISGAATLVLLVPPMVTTHPRSQATLVGGSVTFGGAATGTAPLSYQWYFSGNPIIHATNTTYLISNVQNDNYGDYFVVVSNAYGSATSQVATLSVALPPQITVQPANRFVWVGTEVILTTSASGTAPLSYRWHFNGTPIPNATNNQLRLSAASYANAGNYHCVVTNPYAVTTSAVAVVTVSSGVISSIAAWGDNRNGQTNVPVGLRDVVALGSGLNNCVGLRSDGSVVAWGGITVPPGLSNIVAFAGGGAHSVILRTNGSVIAWGDNSYGQTNVPAGLGGVVAVAAGLYYSLALRADGSVRAWGSYWNGSGSYVPMTVPTGLSQVVAIAAGTDHCVALRSNGTVAAWGSPYFYGQTNIPPGLSNVVAIAAGSAHSLALRRDGTVVGWGRNTERQVTIPSGLSNVVAIAAGGFHSLALRADHTVVAWGENFFGGTNVPAGLSNAVAIAGGEFHSLALVNVAAVDVNQDGVPDNDADTDGDGVNNWQEWLAGTDPTRANSVLRIEALLGTNQALILQFEAVANRPYGIEYRNDIFQSAWSFLANVPAASSNHVVQVPQSLSEATNRFYRVNTTGPQ